MAMLTGVSPVLLVAPGRSRPFTHKRAPFNDDWIEIDDRHYIRHSAVVDVRVEGNQARG